MIQHVALEVTRDRVDACVEFYELLDFEQVEPPESLRDRAAGVERGGTQVHLLYVEEPVVVPRGHVAVVVDDWQSTFERLREAGHAVEQRREHWGSPRAYVRDPAGHLIELMAFPPR